MDLRNHGQWRSSNYWMGYTNSPSAVAVMKLNRYQMRMMSFTGKNLHHIRSLPKLWKAKQKLPYYS